MFHFSTYSFAERLLSSSLIDTQYTWLDALQDIKKAGKFHALLGCSGTPKVYATWPSYDIEKDPLERRPCKITWEFRGCLAELKQLVTITVCLLSPFGFFSEIENCPSMYSALCEDYLPLDARMALVSISHLTVLGKRKGVSFWHPAVHTLQSWSLLDHPPSESTFWGHCLWSSSLCPLPTY